VKVGKTNLSDSSVPILTAPGVIIDTPVTVPSKDT
jgi:hypothetical protein